MKPRAAVMAVLAALAGGAAWGYQYPVDRSFVAPGLGSVDASSWTQKSYWPTSVRTSPGGLISDSGGVALLSTLQAAGAAYEVRMTVRPDPATNRKYLTYLAASADAFMGYNFVNGEFGLEPQWNVSGTFLAVELATNYPNGCLLTVKQRLANGTMTTLGATAVGAWDGMAVRSVYGNNALQIFVDNVLVLSFSNLTAGAGLVGVGVYDGDINHQAGILSAQIGPLDTFPPEAVNANSVAVYAQPAQINLQWAGAQDGAYGIGVWCYGVERDGVYLGTWPSAALADPGRLPDTTYTYRIYAIDYHGNAGPYSAPITVRTPPAGTAEPRRVGVRGTGAYWGAGGESIDVLNGNLNFTLPLLKVVGRNGMSVPVALVYNSQNWRRDAAGTFQLGRDVGFGFGWKLLAGSLTPYYRDSWTVDHYVWTDATGAEYTLGVNTGGVWTSRETAAVTYDSAAAKLWFNDGTFWKLNAVAGGAEEDAGTRYPTLVQNSNGNQIKLTYAPGRALGWENSSARLQSIEDTRLPGQTSYYFQYTSEATPHLGTISDRINSGESYTLGYLNGVTLVSPFDGVTAFGGTRLLQFVRVASNFSAHTFTYGANSLTNPGELTQATLPYGGELRWTYGTFTYAGQLSYREVTQRDLVTVSGGTATSHTLTHPGGDGALSFHSGATLTDVSANAAKVWTFETAAASPYAGLALSFSEKATAPDKTLVAKTFTYAQDSGLRPYVAETQTTLDPGEAFAVTTKTAQTLDAYGNLTGQQVYAFNALAAPARSYSMSYVTAASYLACYLRNRLWSATVTPAGGAALGLGTNSYDSGTPLPSYGALPLWGGTCGPRGNVTGRNAPGQPARTLEYDGFGNVVREYVAGALSETTYSSATSYTMPATVSVAGASTFQWNSFFGLSNAAGPNGDQTGVLYNAGLPRQTTSPEGAVTDFTYVFGAGGSTTATTGTRYTRKWFDGLGRVKLAESGTYNGAAYTAVSYVETRYAPCACSPLGKVERVSLPYAPGTAEAAKVWTVYTYDALGRTLTVRAGVTQAAPNGVGTTSYLYQANAVTVTDPAGRWKKQIYDAFGNLAQVVEPDPAAQPAGTHITNYTYNARNQMTQVSMPRGTVTQTRTWVYSDVTGLLTSTTFPENGTTTYTYDSNLRLATKTGARGNVISYTYDTLNRVTQITRTVAGTSSISSFSYDDTTPGTNRRGRLWRVNESFPMPDHSTQNFTETFAYTPSGRLAEKTLNTLTLGYAYDSDGRVTKVTYPGGTSYDYTYNTRGLPAAVQRTGANGPEAYNAVYDLAGRMTSLRECVAGWGLLMDGMIGCESEQTRTWEYNALGQMTRLTASDSGSYGAPFDLSYTYSATANDGRIATARDNLKAETISYTYDLLGRLASAAAVSTAPWGLSWVYDGFGNRVQQNVTQGSGPMVNLTVDGATNRISSGSGYSYDANGNQTMPGWFAWDGGDRLMGVSGGTAYGYNWRNQRVYRNENGVVTWTLYGAGGERMGEYDAVFDGRRSWVYFAGRALKQTRDRVGSVADAAAPSGLSYFPYGEERVTRTADGSERFGTYQRDVGTGLDYAMNRYYSATVGRFVSPDPYEASAGPGNSQSWNRYAYVENDAVNRADPSGLLFETCSFSWTPDAFVSGQCGGDMYGDLFVAESSPKPWSMWGRDLWIRNPTYGWVGNGYGQIDPSSINWDSISGSVLSGNLYFFDLLSAAGGLSVPCPTAGPLTLPCALVKFAGLSVAGAVALYEAYKAWERRRSQAGQAADIDWAKEQLKRQCGVTLTPAQQRRVHDQISGQDLTKEEILEIMKDVVGCRGR